jgi:electron transfer flavoprotein-quinone oxidoreductase
LEAYRKAPDFMENHRMFNEYPQLATGLVSKMFTVDGTPPVHMLGKILSQVKENRISLTKLAGDSLKGARFL